MDTRTKTANVADVNLEMAWEAEKTPLWTNIRCQSNLGMQMNGMTDLVTVVNVKAPLENIRID